MMIVKHYVFPTYSGAIYILFQKMVIDYYPGKIK